MPRTYDDVSNKAEDTMAQLARLRDQVESLMREKVAQVMDGSERVEAAAYEAADAVRERADALAVNVRERPLTAVLIAAGVGYLLGRLRR